MTAVHPTPTPLGAQVDDVIARRRRRPIEAAEESLVAVEGQDDAWTAGHLRMELRSLTESYRRLLTELERTEARS